MGTLLPCCRVSLDLNHGRHEEGRGDEEGRRHEEGCHEGSSDEGRHEEGEEGGQRDEEGGDEGPGHEEGHEEGRGAGGLRESEWGRFPKLSAQQTVACCCGCFRRAWPEFFGGWGLQDSLGKLICI